MFRKTARDEEIEAGRAAEAADRASRWLFRAVAVLFALLLIAQALVAVDAVRERISPVDRQEGHRISFAPLHGHVLY